ncbi:MAG: hypothetical protein U0W65_10245 [Bacteroidia bacterium]
MKKQAEKYFDDEDYNLAYKLYAQLVSLYPKDPDYNYKLGVCMLYTEPDKKKPYSYLQIATKNPNDAPKDALFYLAKTNHINYKFDEAIKLYTEYKKIGSASSIKKLQVDREIQACKNGKRLLSNLTDLVIISKKQLNEIDYFKAYDVKEIGGKLLIKPDDYISAYDKKKKDKSVVYLPKTGERLYYSSYGENGNTGRDIYYVNRLPNGSWSKPTMLPSTINTEFDEDYPFLHPNGKTLYFSSKGHNSMGGYDVFKTTYDATTQTWSKPENMEFPISSPDDDILFVTDSLEKTAFFSTGRYSPYGKIDVLKINTERRPMNFAYIKGTVVKEEATQSLKSKITVKNMENGEIVGTFQAADNGDYNLELPNGGKFLFTVETPGINTQSDAVNVPVAYTLKPYKQMISYDNKILKITNYFDGSVSDENYSMMIDLIEKKAKLEVNESEPYNTNLIKDNKNQNASGDNNANNLNSVSTNNPTVQSSENGNNTTKTNTNKNVTNEQLLEIAKTDAKEASDEATKLKKEAQDAFGLATQKTAESVEKQKAAEEAINNANTIADVAKKNEELTKANQLKEEAKIATNVANTATNMAKKLEVDASIQQKEADLTNQYVTQLEAVTKNKNNKEALTKLEEIQKELDNISKQKNQSDELFTSLKAEAELKKQELSNTEKKNTAISNEINAIKNEAENLEKDLANENDKSIKENISAQIRELNNEIDLKNKELATNNQKISTLQSEVDGVNQEIMVAAKILNESTDGIAIKNDNSNVNGNNSSLITTNNTVTANTALSVEGITNKYKDKVNSTPIDKNNKESVSQQNEIYKTYNKEINDLIALDKNEINKTKDANEKKKLNDEIKQLEKQKTENDKIIATNNSIIKQLESNAIANNSASNNNNGTAINSNSENSNTNSNGNNITDSNVSDEANSKNAIYSNSVATSSNGTNVNNSKNENSSSTTNAITNNNESNKTNNNENSITNSNNVINQENNSSTNNNTTVASNTTNVISNNNNNINNNTENQTAITNNNASDNEVIKPINPNSTDNTAFLNELSNLKNGLNANSNAAKDIFAYNDYKESTSLTLKQAAAQKFEASKQNEENLNALITKTENNIKLASGNNPSTLISEADQLSNKAYEQRKESTTKTGAEKENLLKQAVENEKAAVDKKLEASVAQQKQNKARFDNNIENLTELQKLTGEKTSNEISQANMLVDEAALNFKQAQKMRQEADAYPSGAAKLGGLSNAEEKENEALAKQQKALEVLSKVNPSYKVKTLDDGTNPASSIATINTEVTKATQSQVDAYLALSKANQNELKLQNDQLVKNPAFKNPNNKQAQDLKTASDKLNAEAKALIGQSVTAVTPAEKANLLLKANEKEIAAIKTLNQAVELTKSGSAIAATNNNPTNNGNTNISNTSGSNNNVNNTNAVSSNTVANNNNKTNNNETSVTNTNVTPTNTVAANNKNNATNNETNNISNNATDTTTNTPNNNTNSNAANNNLSVNNENSNNNPDANNKTSISTNNTKGNGVKDEASKLKTDLVNPNESKILTFNPYLDAEASDLKNKATEKINSAINEDKNIKASLDYVSQIASNSTVSSAGQGEINALLTDADRLNNEASTLRKNAASKTGTEKENDINAAKKLEAEALTKKVDAANKQQQLNTANYEANKQSLEELAAMAKGKNITELNNADVQNNEVTQLIKQANNLRTEANAYPSDAAKLGGYGNAEEKENQAIAKQDALLTLYKKYFPDYVPKKANVSSENNEAVAKLNETKNIINSNNQNHVDGLSLLIQANDKEYTSRLNAVPSTLTETQNNLKTKAATAFSKKEETVTKANQESDLAKKKNLLISANKYGVEALSNLNQIANPNASPITFAEENETNTNVAANTSGNNNTQTTNGNNKNNNVANNNSNVKNNSGNNNTNINSGNNSTANNNTSANNSNASNTNITNTANVTKLKVEGLEVKNNNAYTAAKPIPIDEKIQDGLVFKVQIGAFKSPLPNNTFKGLSPVIGQTTPNGYIRYMAGNFDQYSSANAVKNDLRNLGYSDAFVVAYYNGVRINLNEATEKAKAAGQTIEPVANTSAGITANSNVPKNTFTPATNNNVTVNNTVDSQPAEITNELEKMNGLLYTVQIGVYSKQVTRGQLFNLKPIYTEKLPNGLYRYTAGIYNQSGKLLEDKRKVVDLGVRDAFVSAYYNAKRIPFAEGQKLQTENNNLKMEAENPIIFNGTSASINNTAVPTTNNTTTQPAVNNTPTPTVAPFSNGVTSGPAPTAENGVKTDEAGISFKVQIGAYKNQVPNDVASKFLNIKTWPVQNVVINGLYIYTIGNFTSAAFAKKLKDEAVSLGINDAYITVYKDGKKLYGAEATQYLTR